MECCDDHVTDGDDDLVHHHACDSWLLDHLQIGYGDYYLSDDGHFCGKVSVLESILNFFHYYDDDVEHIWVTEPIHFIELYPIKTEASKQDVVEK